MEPREEEIAVIEDIARKLRETACEHGAGNLEGAVIIGPKAGEDRTELLGLEFVECATQTNYTLGRVSYKVTRTFEDA